MNSDFFQKTAIYFLLVFALTSCSGPQMISAPPKSDTDIPAAKTNGSTDEIKSKNDTSDDRGIFDDEKFQLKTDLKQWKLIDDDDGIQTYEKIKSDSGLVAFRGEILIPAPLKKVASILINDSLQKDWVDSFVETKTISEKNDFDHVEYNQTKVPWPFQNRDFVFRVLAKAHALPPTMLITMKSIEDPAAPPIEGITRGEIIHSYYYLKEASGFRATKMVVEMEVDPKGTIPLWLVNLSQKGWPHNTLAAVKKLCLREDIPVVSRIEKFFETKVEAEKPKQPKAIRGKKK